MTNPTVKGIASFAVPLLSVAHSEIRHGYLDMLRTFRGNPLLGERIRNVGFSAVLAGNDPMITALQKANRELVTDAEKRAERMLRDEIHRNYPNHSLTGEELPDQVREQEWMWSIDPVDGTSAMVRSALIRAYGLPMPEARPAFGISIGVLHGDTAVLGVIGELMPHEDDLELGRVWVGGTEMPATCDGSPMLNSEVDTSRDPLLACTIPEVMFTTADNWGSFQALTDIAGNALVDQNCVGYMGLLDGSVDIVYERDLLLPDAAAVVPILRSAGVVVTDHQGHPTSFAPAARGQEYVLLAARPALHDHAVTLTSAGVSGSRNRFGAADPIELGYTRKVH
ncbi:inositol monophosphatase family protein [Nocardia brasiliensis]|uniref:inositol monophosphatase family protein n=1 Tax=Nocardia brasiliensis TaxID=37326 RepID=UPI002458A613|nr:inositol monophosphatase family protein [Nocardia brasiliensis]